MSIRYYDDAIVQKLQKWLPDTRTLRVLKPSETKRLFQTLAADQGDKQIRLPLIALSRNPDIQLLESAKTLRSFNGLQLAKTQASTLLLNIIPIKAMYQIDIYTKTQQQGDQLLRTLLFKLLNNPTLKIVINYNSCNFQHIANLRVQSNVSDTSDISQRIFSGQFTRWTIQMQLQDAFFFNAPYKQNYSLGGIQVVSLTKDARGEETGELQAFVTLESI